MENRDRDKMSQSKVSTDAGNINRGVSQDQSKSDTSAEFGQKIGRSEDKLNEPSSRTGSSIGSSGMDSGSSDLGSDKDLGSKESSWGDKGSQGSSRH